VILFLYNASYQSLRTKKFHLYRIFYSVTTVMMKIVRKTFLKSSSKKCSSYA